MDYSKVVLGENESFDAVAKLAQSRIGQKYCLQSNNVVKTTKLRKKKIPVADEGMQ